MHTCDTLYYIYSVHVSDIWAEVGSTHSIFTRECPNRGNQGGTSALQRYKWSFYGTNGYFHAVASRLLLYKHEIYIKTKLEQGFYTYRA